MMAKARRWAAVGLMCLGLNQAAFPADASQAVLDAVNGLQEQLARQQEQLARQQTEIEALRKQLEAQQSVSPTAVSEIVKTQVDQNLDQRLSETGLAQIKDVGARITLPSHVDGLKIKADLRLRYEQHNNHYPGSSSYDDTDADRFRTRFRLGGVWTSSDESWEVGAGLATGDFDGSKAGGAGATSTNQTWSEDDAFGSMDIGVDYAYAKHKWEDLSLTLGQQKNPFATSWLLWDSDVRPIGATGQARAGDFFATAGAYDVVQTADHNVGGLFAGQVGYELKGESGGLLVALAYYDYQGDVVEEKGGVASGDYDYDIGDLYVKATTNVGDVGVTAYGDVFVNFGADGGQSQRGASVAAGGLDPDGEDTGWVLGLQLKWGRWKLGYAYVEVEADAAGTGLKDADFGKSGTGYDTDIKGHVLEFGYKFTKNFSLGIEADLMEAIEMDSERETDLYQVDLKYKF